MEISVIHGRGRRAAAVILLTVLVLISAAPAVAEDRGDRFSGYPEDVRIQALRVVAAAGPAAKEGLRTEVRLLCRKMHGRGILSVNALPDAIFERAVEEGWKGRVEGSIRIASSAAPLSVPMWAWLAVKDLSSFRISDAATDLRAFAWALRIFAPALLGFAAWGIAYLSATGLWFAVWVGLSMFLRARPALQADVGRFLSIPYKEYVAPFVVCLIFLAPLLAGCGVAVTVSVWLLASTGYLRRREVAVVTVTIAMLALVLFGGGILASMESMQGQTREGGWLGGEGAFARRWADAAADEDLFPTEVSRMVRFARARAAMQSGRLAESEEIWTDLLRETPAPPAEIHNNRGIARAQQGRLKAALEDFEAALARSPKEPAPLWNAYQTYLALFNIEKARTLQGKVWESMEGTFPYKFRPAEMEQGEWLASPLPVEDVWEIFVRFRGDWVNVVGRSDFFRLFFRPLKARIALLFLVTVGLAAALWKILALKIWIYRTCRSCGAQNLIVGAREASDLCTACRSRLGDSPRGGDEREKRVLRMALHRKYVNACSVLVPGAGAFWAGRDVFVLAYGVLLALFLGAVSTSVGASGGGASLVADLQRWVARAAVAGAVLLWAGGAVWSLRAFRRLQWEQGISLSKKRR